MQDNSNIKTVSKKDLKYLGLWCAGLGLFWVIFIWGFWQKGIFALGLNTSVFLVLTFIIFSKIYHRTEGANEGKLFQKQNAVWLVPVFFIILSFFLYENPFIKTINLFVYPVAFLLFYWHAQFGKEGKFLSILPKILHIDMGLFENIGKAGTTYFDFLIPKQDSKKARVSSILIGIALFILIAFTVIIPLLSSADKVFGQRIDFIYNWFKEFITTAVFAKFVFLYIFSVVSLAFSITWMTTLKSEEKTERTGKKVDSIVAGIVLGGILVLYSLFLAIQFNYLFLGNLPIDFKTTETLVKSGFWQLFALTIVNIAIFLFTFRKTSAFVQKILTFFTAASFLLLLSAGYRMGLYVAFYGLSYEKLYASYTVIFCAILLIWLFTKFSKKGEVDIIKFLAFLFLWMYSLIAVFPAEQFIARTNIALSRYPESRINLYELTMLSSDVLGLVKKEKNGTLAYSRNQDPLSMKELQPIDWQPWINRQEERLRKKRWYERNLGN